MSPIVSATWSNPCFRFMKHSDIELTMPCWKSCFTWDFIYIHSHTSIINWNSPEDSFTSTRLCPNLSISIGISCIVSGSSAITSNTLPPLVLKAPFLLERPELDNNAPTHPTCASAPHLTRRDSLLQPSPM